MSIAKTGYRFCLANGLLVEGVGVRRIIRTADWMPKA